MSIARSTPAQNERGAASSTRRGPAQVGPLPQRRTDAAQHPQRADAPAGRWPGARTGVSRCRRRPGRRRSGPPGRAARARSRPTPCRRRARRWRRAARAACAADDVVGADDRAGVHAQPERDAARPTSGAARAQHGAAVLVADLARDDDVARRAASGPARRRRRRRRPRAGASSASRGSHCRDLRRTHAAARNVAPPAPTGQRGVLGAQRGDDQRGQVTASGCLRCALR